MGEHPTLLTMVGDASRPDQYASGRDHTGWLKTPQPGGHRGHSDLPDRGYRREALAWRRARDLTSRFEDRPSPGVSHHSPAAAHEALKMRQLPSPVCRGELLGARSRWAVGRRSGAREGASFRCRPKTGRSARSRWGSPTRA